MADEQPQVEPEVKSSKKSGLSPKVFIIGIPLFIIQLVLVYFVTGYIYHQKYGEVYVSDVSNKEANHGTDEHSDDVAIGDSVEIGKNIFSVDDIILNPAGTNGQMVMLVSVGFDVASAEMKTVLEEREVLVRDMIISNFSSKHLDELSDISFRDSLKHELSSGVSDMFGQVKVNQVYFSKYIIQ